jgi:hypothetical protein
MGCNSTFKKRRHNYKGALGLEIKVRGIVTNYVVYYFNLLHASRKLVETHRTRGADSFENFEI